jgi:hypothetical protein
MEVSVSLLHICALFFTGLANLKDLVVLDDRLDGG